jgi:hypothetical protein
MFIYVYKWLNYINIYKKFKKNLKNKYTACGLDLYNTCANMEFKYSHLVAIHFKYLHPPLFWKKNI